LGFGPELFCSLSRMQIGAASEFHEKVWVRVRREGFVAGIRLCGSDRAAGRTPKHGFADSDFGC